jgi:hypothetical protein
MQKGQSTLRMDTYQIREVLLYQTCIWFQNLLLFIRTDRRLCRCASPLPTVICCASYTVEEVYQLCQQQLGPAKEVREGDDEVRAPFLDREGPMNTIIETVSDLSKRLCLSAGLQGRESMDQSGNLVCLPCHALITAQKEEVPVKRPSRCHTRLE